MNARGPADGARSWPAAVAGAAIVVIAFHVVFALVFHRLARGRTGWGKSARRRDIVQAWCASRPWGETRRSGSGSKRGDEHQ